jgi:hypothetical protein
MRAVVLGTVLAMIAAAPALAQAPSTANAGKDAAAVASEPSKEVKRLYVCDNSNLTKRGFTREFGSADFVDAKEAVRAGEAWAAPRCISSVEAKRLKRMKLAQR